MDSRLKRKVNSLKGKYHADGRGWRQNGTKTACVTHKKITLKNDRFFI